MDEKELSARLLALELNQDFLIERLEAMELKAQKLELAYYQAFPDRADGDLQFENQLQSLVLLSKRQDEKRKQG
jgi:hypothetical protein